MKPRPPAPEEAATYDVQAMLRGLRAGVNNLIGYLEREPNAWQREGRIDAWRVVILMIDEMLSVHRKPTRWHEGMREWQAGTISDSVASHFEPLCWAYVSDTDVCIQPLGHDNGAHEP